MLKNEWLLFQITNIKRMLKHGAYLALRATENSQQSNEKKIIVHGLLIKIDV